MQMVQVQAKLATRNRVVWAADADINVASADKAWANGVLFSNGNYALRHVGVPTVTVAMGLMSDIGMPVGLTFAALRILAGWRRLVNHWRGIHTQERGHPSL